MQQLVCEGVLPGTMQEKNSFVSQMGSFSLASLEESILQQRFRAISLNAIST
jgi:hypothetical protein